MPVIVSRLRGDAAGRARKIRFPRFVLCFGAVIAAASLVKLPADARKHPIDFDTVLLSCAMFALGVGSRRQRMKQAGTRPLLLATVIFAVLVSGGWLITLLIV